MSAQPTSVLSAGRVLLFGELLADVFPQRRVAGGAPFNVSCHLQGFGAAPLLATRVGCDELACFLTDAMQRFSLDTQLLQTDTRRGSGRVDVIPSATGHRFDIPPDQAFDRIDGGVLADAMRHLPPPQWVYFGTLAQRHETSRAALHELLEHLPSPRFVDLNLRPPWVNRDTVAWSLAQATVLKLSDEELRTVGSWQPEDSAQASDDHEVARRLAQRYGIQWIVVTCGERGAWCLADSRVTVVPAMPLGSGEGDTVGAGDAFAAVTLLGLLSGWPMALTLGRASRFAAAICAIQGAVPESPAFYRPFLDEWMKQ